MSVQYNTAQDTQKEIQKKQRAREAKQFEGFRGCESLPRFSARARFGFAANFKSYPRANLSLNEALGRTSVIQFRWSLPGMGSKKHTHMLLVR